MKGNSDAILKPIEGRMVLYCKGHYKCDAGLLEGLRMIWAARCGYEHTPGEKRVDLHIAEELYGILYKLWDGGPVDLQRRVHSYLANDLNWHGEELTAFEKLIRAYRSLISQVQVNEHDADGKVVPIVKLPKPAKRVFNRILRGNGRYEDYKLLNAA